MQTKPYKEMCCYKRSFQNFLWFEDLKGITSSGSFPSSGLTALMLECITPRSLFNKMCFSFLLHFSNQTNKLWTWITKPTTFGNRSFNTMLKYNRALLIQLNHSQLCNLSRLFVWISYEKFPTWSPEHFSKKNTGNRGESRAAETSNMKCFVITKYLILDVAAALDPPLGNAWLSGKFP